MNTALEWFKSSYSSEQGGACVEVAAHPTAVHVRDSKNPGGPMLTLAPGVWSSFAAFAGGHSATHSSLSGQ
ncbi:DUF397 domain-containing protein [Streptomyces sp. NPDC006678]|uniref:DUF397 domain-containing protein n=1 Tax=Streptomyces sp. NPDC006678 TaxID=3157185 RepID=UPI0033F66CAD